MDRNKFWSKSKRCCMKMIRTVAHEGTAVRHVMTHVSDVGDVRRLLLMWCSIESSSSSVNQILQSMWPATASSTRPTRLHWIKSNASKPKLF